MGICIGRMTSVPSSVQPLAAGCFTGAKWVVHSKVGGSNRRLGTQFVCVALRLRDNLDNATYIATSTHDFDACDPRGVPSEHGTARSGFNPKANGSRKVSQLGLARAQNL
jgi:hypothetical protein